MNWTTFCNRNTTSERAIWHELLGPLLETPVLKCKLLYTVTVIIIIIIITSFYSLCSTGHPWRASRHCDLQLFPLPHSMIFLFFLFYPLLSFAMFSSIYLFFYIPKDYKPMLFSLLLLLLCVMCVQSNSISFFFLLASVGWFFTVLHL